MAKRSREDYEPSSPESQTTGELPATTRTGIRPSTIDTPASTPKFVHLDLESGEAPPATEMQCSLPPHRHTLTFTSFEQYDVHYAKTHTNRCLECKKNFPTEHFLNLHIEENHDSLISVRRERGEKTVCPPRPFSNPRAWRKLTVSVCVLRRGLRPNMLYPAEETDAFD